MNKPYDIAITVGVFDCLHEGHVNLFQEMQKKANRLFILIHDDKSTFENKKRFPIQYSDHRMNNIGTILSDAEFRFVFCSDPSRDLQTHINHILEENQSIVYMRGDDWKDFPGKSTVEELGIPIEYVPYTEGVSTTQIRNELKK